MEVLERMEKVRETGSKRDYLGIYKGEEGFGAEYVPL